MERFIALGGAALLLSATSAPANAQVANPVYANLFWEDTGVDWDSTSGPFTTDFCSSILWSELQSQWATYMIPWGVSVPNGQFPLSYVITPAAASQAACAKVTPPAGADVNAFAANGAAFIACAQALHPELSNSNMIYNVFMPVRTGAPTQGGQWSTNAAAYNAFIAGHSVTYMPVASWAESSTRELAALISHEVVETTTQQRNVADPCEGLAWPNFLDYQIEDFFMAPGQAGYYSYGGTGTGTGIANCGPYFVSNDGAPPYSNLNPAPFLSTTIAACGSGRYMIIDEQVDVTGGRNSAPWDVPAPTGSQYQGSLYFDVDVRGGTPNGGWTAGGEHFVGSAYPNPAEPALLSWAASGAIAMNGFGQGYGSGITINPGDSVSIRSYDPAWGELNENSNGAPPSTKSEQAAFIHAIWKWLNATSGVVNLSVTGANKCGLWNEISQAPVANVDLTVSGAVAGDAFAQRIITDDNGDATVAWSFDSSPHPIRVSAPGGVSAILEVDCVSNGQPAPAKDYCCSNIWIGGFCQGCYPAGESVSGPGQCCDGSQLKGDALVCCVTNGNQTETASQCCSGLASGSRCVSCYEWGTVASASQCCNDEVVETKFGKLACCEPPLSNCSVQNPLCCPGSSCANGRCTVLQVP